MSNLSCSGDVDLGNNKRRQKPGWVLEQNIGMHCQLW